MQLWTHHPSDFKVDAIDLVCDHTKGQYWVNPPPGCRYREVLTKLQSLLNTKQFLWCCTTRGTFLKVSEEFDLVEWELNIPDASLLRFIHTTVWEDILYERCDDWESLFVSWDQTSASEITVLVLLPIDPAWVKCHGQLAPQNRRENPAQPTEG